MSETIPPFEQRASFEGLPPIEQITATILYYVRPFADHIEPDTERLNPSYETLIETLRPSSPEGILPEQKEHLERFLKSFGEVSRRWRLLQNEINDFLERRQVPTRGERLTVLQVTTASDSARTQVESLAILERERGDVFLRARELRQEWDQLRATIRSEHDKLTSKYGEQLWVSVAKHISNVVAEEIPLDD